MATNFSSGYLAHTEGINYLFGYPISHSMSPLLHQTIYKALNLPWRQSLFESKDMDKFLQLTKDPRFFGIPPDLKDHKGSLSLLLTTSHRRIGYNAPQNLHHSSS